MSENDIILEIHTLEDDPSLPPNEAKFVRDVNRSLEFWKREISNTFTILEERKAVKSTYLGYDLQNKFRHLYMHESFVASEAIGAGRRYGVRQELVDKVIADANTVKKQLQKARKHYKIAADEIADESFKCRQDEAFLQRLYLIVQHELNQLRDTDVPIETAKNYVRTITERFAYPSEELVREWVKKNNRRIRPFEADGILGKAKTK